MKYQNTTGFSLVELIVVVAVIGILATLSVPMYSNMSFKSRKSEAKTMMAGIYTAEKSFYAEYNVFQSSFPVIGFSPEGGAYFNVGFSRITTATLFGRGYPRTPTVAELDNTNTKTHCNSLGAPSGIPGYPGNSCRLLVGPDGDIPSDIPLLYTTSNSTFNVGAIASAPFGIAALEDEIDGTLKLLHGTNPVLFALRAAFSQSSAQASDLSHVTSLSLNENKNFEEISCPTYPRPAGTTGPMHFVKRSPEGILYCTFVVEF